MRRFFFFFFSSTFLYYYYFSFLFDIPDLSPIFSCASVFHKILIPCLVVLDVADKRSSAREHSRVMAVINGN